MIDAPVPIIEYPERLQSGLLKVKEDINNSLVDKAVKSVYNWF